MKCFGPPQLKLLLAFLLSLVFTAIISAPLLCFHVITLGSFKYECIENICNSFYNWIWNWAEDA